MSKSEQKYTYKKKCDNKCKDEMLESATAVLIVVGISAAICFWLYSMPY